MINVFILVIFATQAFAFTVSPMLATIDMKQPKSYTFVVHNDSDEAIRIQNLLYEKKQKYDGNYEDVPTEILSVFPPLAKINANSTRAIRIRILPKYQSEAAKHYYKLLVQELPKGESTDVDSVKKGVSLRIQTTTAFHIPVYVYPVNIQFSIHIKEAFLDNQELVTTLENKSNSTIRLVDQFISLWVNNAWMPASNNASGRVNALVYQNTITLRWPCPNCKGVKISKIKLEGEAANFGTYSLVKTLGRTTYTQ